MLALVAGFPERALAQDQQPTMQPPSQAPPKAEPKPETPAIVITGSRIPRTNLTAVSPVTMVTQQEIELQGATNTEELLNALPQITPSEGAFLTNGATGTASIQLRELGEPRTLVLLNGHRLGPGSPDFPFPDVNNIPPSLIQRIDVLTGGASSVYGSDAVAGVVNIILDTHFNGVRLDAQASVFEHDNRNGSGLVDAIQARGFGFPRGQVADGARQDVNISFGRGFLGGRGHLALYVGYRKLRSVTQDRRDYSACAADLDDDTGELICGGSPASFPANFQTQLGDIFQVGPDRTFEPGFSLFNFAPTNYFQRPDRRYTAGAFADLEISQSVHPYLEAMFMDDRSVAQIAPSGDFGNTTTINCDNPLLSPQQRSLVCVAGNFVGETIDENGDVTGSPTKFIDPITGAPYLIANLEIDRRNVEGGGRQEDLRHKNGRLLAGLKGDVGRGVTYDTSYIYGRATLHAAHLNDFSKTRLARALDVLVSRSKKQRVDERV